MHHPGDDLDLLQKTVGADGGGDVGAHDLQGDIPVMLAVVGDVDRRHPAAAEDVAELVTFAQCPGEVGGNDGSHATNIRRKLGARVTLGALSPPPPAVPYPA